MSLIKDLSNFLDKKQIKGADVNAIFNIIRQEEGVNASFNEFWQNILKKSCKDNTFDAKKFTVLLEGTRFSENDIRDFFNVEYLSSEDKEEKIKETLSIKEKILGQKCTNIKFDLLISDALWGFDPNDSSFFENWATICREVNKVEKEIRSTNTFFSNNQHEDFTFLYNLHENIEEDCTEQISALGTIVNNYD